MSSNPLKVALLAQAGPARDRLREAIEAAGAQCVLESDPQEIDPADVPTSEAKVVLVALDPQTEDALEAFDEVLADPDVEVIYEEASLAAAREGWDMARWQRHLVAKMQSHGDVLPPGTEQEAPETGQSTRFDHISSAAGDAPEREWQGGSAAPAETTNPFDPVFAETADQESGHVPVFEPGDVADGLDLSLTLDPVVDNEDAAAVEASAEPRSPATAVASDEEGEAAGRFGVLTLDDGSAPLVSGDSEESDDRLARDIVELEERISGLTLVDDSPRKEPEHARGAVLVLAGLGGPDAVRQLVAAMPAGFPRPVLIQQRLDGGRHDRLVAQMQRATELPVRLAEADQYAMAGTVYILAEELGIDVSDAGIRFQTGSELVASLPSSDSAVLLLSGTDPSVVDATLRLGWAGALVAGQSADGCYDATASAALASRGGDTATPAELAQRLGERWPA